MVAASRSDLLAMIKAGKPRKVKPLRFCRVAEPKLPGERKLVVIDKDEDRQRNLARVSVDRTRNNHVLYPYDRREIADWIIKAQRARK